MADKTVKVNTKVQFNDSSTNATSYAWNFGDENTSTVKSPSHTYTTVSPVGIPYVVAHSAVNSCGTSTCNTKTVEVVAELPSQGSNTIIIIGAAAAVIGFLILSKKK